jgi:hypothetical protein
MLKGVPPVMHINSRSTKLLPQQIQCDRSEAHIGTLETITPGIVKILGIRESRLGKQLNLPHEDRAPGTKTTWISDSEINSIFAPFDRFVNLTPAHCGEFISQDIASQRAEILIPAATYEVSDDPGGIRGCYSMSHIKVFFSADEQTVGVL